MRLIEWLTKVNNVKTYGGCYICTGCGKVIPVGQEHWDDLDLPWHRDCVPEVEVVREEEDVTL